MRGDEQLFAPLIRSANHDAAPGRGLARNGDIRAAHLHARKEGNQARDPKHASPCPAGLQARPQRARATVIEVGYLKHCPATATNSRCATTLRFWKRRNSLIGSD